MESTNSETMNQQPNCMLFVSHSSKDKALVDALVDLLITGVDVHREDIFCTSLEGMGIPKGKNFIEHIRSQIQHPKLVISVLSQNYFESVFCLCELGATWAMSLKFHPLLVPPHGYDDLKAVLVGVEVGKLDRKKDLNDLRDDVASSLGISTSSTARWESKRDEFLDKFENIVIEQKAVVVEERDSSDMSTEAADTILSDIGPLSRDVQDTIGRILELTKRLHEQWISSHAFAPLDADSALALSKESTDKFGHALDEMADSDSRTEFPSEFIHLIRETKERFQSIESQIPISKSVGGGLEARWKNAIDTLKNVLKYEALRSHMAAEPPVTFNPKNAFAARLLRLHEGFSEAWSDEEHAHDGNSDPQNARKLLESTASAVWDASLDYDDEIGPNLKKEIHPLVQSMKKLASSEYVVVGPTGKTGEEFWRDGKDLGRQLKTLSHLIDAATF